MKSAITFYVKPQDRKAPKLKPVIDFRKWGIELQEPTEPDY